MLEDTNKSLDVYFQVLWDNLIVDILENSYSEISFVNSYKVQNIFLQMNPVIVFQEDNHFLKDNLAQFLDFIIKKIDIQLPNFYHSNSNGITKYATINFNYHYNTLVQGFNFTLKVLENKPVNDQLVQLGFTDPQQAQILDAIKNKSNILISGVTGSGKTTTMKKIFELITLHYPDLKVAILNHSNFTPNTIYADYDYLDNHDSLTNARNIIHSDFDIICLGEIRSKQDAQAFELLCKNNIQVIGTIHANSALGSFDRLSQIDSHFLIKHINLLINQTLVPTTCPHCAIGFDEVEQLMDDSETEEQLYDSRNVSLLALKIKKHYPNLDLSNVFFENPQGCKDCSYRGCSRMEACAQVITVDPRMHELIEQDEDLIPYLQFLSDENPLSDNMVGKSVKDHAIYKMLTGSLDPSKLIAKFNLFD